MGAARLEADTEPEVAHGGLGVVVHQHALRGRVEVPIAPASPQSFSTRILGRRKRRLFHLCLFLTASRVALPQDPSTVPKCFTQVRDGEGRQKVKVP